MILGLETSCDDTSVALVDRGGVVRALVSAHQDEHHRPFGGVVPEVASRRHTERILPLVIHAMSEAGVSWASLSGIAVTNRPGLIGSLLVGVVTAKTLALTKNLPLIGVNHIEGHLLAPLLRDEVYQPPERFEFPYLALAVSGGHTHLFVVEDVSRYRMLGRTRDDASGEAFDKFAKMMGLGFPGGVRVDRGAAGGDPTAFKFPRALMTEGDLNFSFSGLKSAAARQLATMSDGERELRKADLCASFTAAIVDVLTEKLRRASELTGLKRWALTGGVAANSQLRLSVGKLAAREGATFAVPPLRFCTDNAAMIALAGLKRLERGERSAQDLSPSAAVWPTDWISA